MEAPPVPPKDDAVKRKRDVHDTEDEPSPKRRLSPLPPLSGTEADASEDATPQAKNIRRKKGSRNLSHMNLRHAAEQQAPQPEPQPAKKRSRKSRFIEGSMNDKVSEKPPSMFMRFIRTESGNMKQVQVAQEELMEEYHDSMSEPRTSIDTIIAQEKASIPARVAQFEAAKDNKAEGGMFGKWTSSLHPVALWNKVFAQAREEIIADDYAEAERQAMEEAERKAKEKADIEAQYFQMKAAGMFKPKPIGNIYSTISSRSSAHTPRDSVMDDDSVKQSHESTRTTSYTSGLMAPSQDTSRSASQMSVLVAPSHEASNSTSQLTGVQAFPPDDTTSASDAAETGQKPSKTLKSRLHLKKPSLSNISGSLKRAKSDFSLTQTLHHRESSSSISPIKADFDNSALKKSQSKYDLKKQTKLSKRVSDLESKLSQARKELDDALVEASPMPKLGNRYERFTPQSTLRRPKFVPGKLPSLPSERILMAQQQEKTQELAQPASDVNMNDDEGEADAKDRDLNEFLAEAQVTNNFEDDENEETVKARGPHNNRQYPTRASSLFSIENKAIVIEELAITSTEVTEAAEPAPATGKLTDTSDLTQETAPATNEMDPKSVTDITKNGDVEQKTTLSDYAVLDAKLKAIDTNVEQVGTAKKPATKTKKRKSGADDMDKTYKPGKGTTDDDSEIDEDETPKKKRKSTGGVSSSPNNKRTSRFGFSISPKGKKPTKTSPPKKNSKNAKKTSGTAMIDDDNAGVNGIEADIQMLSARTSFDSQGSTGHSLEPLIEEAEEEITASTTTADTNMPSMSASSKPPAQANSARPAGLSVTGRRSRSNSPSKRPAAGVEENIITRAAAAAKSNPARVRSRSTSPPPVLQPKTAKAGYTVAGAGEEEEPIRVVPGEGGVPDMPKSKKEGGKKKKKNEQGDFEWPDDVF